MDWKMYDSKNSKLINSFETEPFTITMDNCTISSDLMSSITAEPYQNITVTCSPENITYTTIGTYPIKELEERIEKIEKELEYDPRFKFRKGLVII